MPLDGEAPVCPVKTDKELGKEALLSQKIDARLEFMGKTNSGGKSLAGDGHTNPMLIGEYPTANTFQKTPAPFFNIDANHGGELP